MSTSGMFDEVLISADSPIMEEAELQPRLHCEAVVTTFVGEGR